MMTDDDEADVIVTCCLAWSTLRKVLHRRRCLAVTPEQRCALT